jgi:energy-coupling factor transport system permease protein
MPSAAPSATNLTPHPASLILFCTALLVAASSREGGQLAIACSVLMTLALVAARAHVLPLVRRSRWLLLTIVILFGWLTPGTLLTPLPGATQEGLQLAAKNLAYLLVAISVVAGLLTSLSPPQLVAGLRSLLAPFARLKLSPDRIAVRLALTLEQVEASRRGPGSVADGALSMLSLPAASWGPGDAVLGCLTGALFVLAWFA